ncbi:EAL domain-containing protein [Glaciecola sp. 1036]|uniref:putative bifunctional diguanylate cyclase/phosphodiesterase n=1 Tax=Alteromonadaceae TaxID=72275 RepID=UPI003D088150
MLDPTNKQGDNMGVSAPSLMIVEDNPADMTHYMRLLEEAEHNFGHIECITTLEEAALCLENNLSLSCCLLDFNLPDGSALSLIKSFQARNSELNCPIVVVTGQNDTKNAVQLLKLGVQDYVIKDDLTSNTLMRAINNAMLNWELKKQLEHMAMFDSLTDLSNRALFVEKLGQIYHESERYKHKFSLMLLDLDHFKSINDIYGHEAGDFVISTVGETIRSCIRNCDVAGRLGGDEFGIILPETYGDSAYEVAEKLLKELKCDVKYNKSIIPISPSIGITMYPGKARSCKELMREADIALYKAKSNGRGNYECFKQGWNDKVAEKNKLRKSLPLAIKNGELQLAAQPILSSKDYPNVFAIEALVRWQLDRSWVNPMTIIDVVMELGLDAEFHSWLFAEAFQLLQRFKVEQPSLKLCLNLPANLCHSPKITELLTTFARVHTVDPTSVILEVTETHLMTEPDKAKQCLTNLVGYGFNVAIDDFGTGYSSMEYIAELPCTYLKIDKKFFMNMSANKRNKNIIEAITGLAHGLEMDVIAEGIETEELANSAIELDCDFLQGFQFGMPVIPSIHDSFSRFMVACDNNR